MDCIQLMIQEHNNIKRMLVVMRKYSQKVLEGEKVDNEDFFKMIDFVRNYADKHHHGKEEELLFTRMVEEQGTIAEKLVKHGMLVEHDMGRLYMQELEIALRKVLSGDNEARLDVIANAISYTHLLTRHINKEDNMVYAFAQRGLSKETLDGLNKETQKFEKEANNQGTQDKYLKLLEELEEKIK